MELIGLFAETFVHPGSGQAMGAIDLPVARERATNLPYLAASSVKGAFLQRHLGEKSKQDLKQAAELKPGDRDPTLAEAISLFGGPSGSLDGAGQLRFSDGRLLFLPLRSISAPYAWATCPMLLERLWRDLARLRSAGSNAKLEKPAIPKVADEETMLVLANSHFRANAVHLIEDRAFKAAQGLVSGWEKIFEGLLGAEWQRLRKHLVVLDDAAFAWFAEYGLHIQARNALDDDKVSQSLWYEELLPPDSLFYLLVDRRDGKPQVKQDLRIAADNGGGSYVQIGGNESLGQGWFRMLPWKTVK